MQVFEPQPPPATNIHLNNPQNRKRGPRATVACDSCRRLKAKCDQRNPCCVCANNSLECIYRPGRSKRNGAAASQPAQPLVRGQVLTGKKRLQTEYGTSEPQIKLKRISNASTAPKSTRAVVALKPSLPTITARPPGQSYLADARDPSRIRGLSDVIKKNGATDHPAISPLRNDQTEITQSEPHQRGDPGAKERPSSTGIGEINNLTSGTEFYGPAATLAFLTELRSRARTFQAQSSHVRTYHATKGLESKNPRRLSIVNFFHGEDSAVSDSEQDLQTQEDMSNESSLESSGTHRLSQDLFTNSPAVSVPSYDMPPNTEIEKECIELYFANLHLIYYILNKSTFISRCEEEIWSSEIQEPKQRGRRRRSSKFPALYNAVVSVGALTAGDDSALSQSLGKVRGFLDDRSKQLSKPPGRRKPIYPPLELAQTYFARAKALLGDFLEVCSLESTQTLFLMSIFCQYALKPHGCYMYSGMSARTALAIGCANEPDLDKTTVEAIRTWWCMYYHEMEVCCSLGRETFLREPAYYPVFLAKFGVPLPAQMHAPDDENLFFARALTELAHILKRTSDEIYHTASSVSQIDKSQAALVLDESLTGWKSLLSPMFDLESTSLTEPESTTKRKIVLKLRYYSARILIHRSFLVAAAYQRSSSAFASNVVHCLDASRKTIHLLYDTFVNRPFFRTWWYNTTYAFNAITIILYTLVSDLKKGSKEELLEDVEKTLKIFQAMDGITVARRCAELTQEIFEVAKVSLQDQRNRNEAAVPARINEVESSMDGEAAPIGPAAIQSLPSLDMWPDIEGFNGFQDDFFASLIDPNILENVGANLTDLDLDFGY